MKHKKDSIIVTHPYLMNQWNFNKNFVKPEKITKGSNKKIWWICNEKHEWKVSVNNRTSQNSGCPYCANKRVLSGFNDAKTIYPQYQYEYDNNKNNLKYNEILLNSKTKYWWKCTLNHSYQSSGEKKVIGQGCPYCSNRKLLKGFNDLETHYPHLIKQWNFNKNENLLPSDFIYSSHTKVWWICDKSHEWKTQIAFRSTHIRKSNCPDCSKRVSKGEKEVRDFSESIIGEKSIKNNRSIIKPYEIDIYFPKQKIAIEYNGNYWHSDSKIKENHKISAKDYHLMKKSECEKIGIKLIFVWQNDWEHFNEIIKKDIKEALLKEKISKNLTKLTYEGELNTNV